ncbi:MAG: hypothetical protein AAFY41_19630, partial [Bacteroidota bacterium]
PSGSTSERPQGVTGLLRYNTTTNLFEGYDNNGWLTINGGNIWQAADNNAILYNAGNVGIGTNNLSERLVVGGNIFLQNDGRIHWGWPHRCIEQVSNTSGSRIRFRNSMGGSNEEGGFDFADFSGNTVLRIKDFRVGIKTDNLDDGYALTVKGDISTRKVKVTAMAGADYVFDPSYDLLPLKDLENFVEQHHHLPNIAPAKEMEAEGVIVDELLTQLLAKVEELTLYTIAQQKEIEELKAKLAAEKEE